MVRTQAKWVLGTVMFLAVGSATTVEAASLRNLKLVPDGSVQPPGDRLDVALLFDPGEDEVTLQARAYIAVRHEGGKPELLPVAAGDERHRDPDGHVLITSTLRRSPGTSAAHLAIAIPYASLKLSPGRYQIGYELRALRGGRLEFIAPTPLSTLVVSDRVRGEIRSIEVKLLPRKVRKLVTAYTFKDGRAVPQELEIETEVAEKSEQVHTSAAAIPGEFSRPAPIATRGSYSRAPESGDTARGPIVPLENKAWAPLSEFEPRSKRVLSFATNRTVVNPDAMSPARFGTDASPTLTFGSCLVNIPIENHTRGLVEVPNPWWPSTDPSKYFLVESLTVLPRAAWLEQLAPDDVLLSIHGYNTTFEWAVLRTAQLVHDLKFPGKGMAFCWPSAGSLSGYGDDEQNAEKSIASLVELFRQLAAPTGPHGRARSVHAIVHSMGNRVFLGAVRQYELETRERPARKLFGHVALAAPDVDAATFAALLPSLLRQSATATLYYCPHDRALIASQTLHMNKPVGLGPFFAEGLDTINCDNANTSVLGHDYFATAHPLLADLRLMILFNAKPDDRDPPLGPHRFYLGYPHWSFLPAQ